MIELMFLQVLIITLCHGCHDAIGSAKADDYIIFFVYK